jgi:hypothetical protein
MSLSRKIIQIQIDPQGHIIALCDDGTLWVKHDIWPEVVRGLSMSQDKYKVVVFITYWINAIMTGSNLSSHSYGWASFNAFSCLWLYGTFFHVRDYGISKSR